MESSSSVTFSNPPPPSSSQTTLAGTTKKRQTIDLTRKAAKTRMKLAANSALFATSLEAAAKHGSLRGRAQSNWRRAMAAEEEKSKAAAKFKPFQAFYTFMVELLPPYFLSPLLVLIVHGWEKGWHVCGHRRVLPLYKYQIMSDNPNPPSWIFFQARSFLLSFLGPWNASFCTVFFFMNRRLLYDDGFELSEFLIFISFYIVRASVIAIKYGYYSDEDLAKLEEGPDTGRWNVAQSDKKMLLAGWCGTPRLLPGVLQECINDAQVFVEVDLKKLHFKRAHQESLDWNTDGKMEMDCDDADKVSALHVLSRIITSTFGESIFSRTRYVRFCILGVWCVAWTAPVLKVCFGLPMFGTKWQTNLMGGLVIVNETIFATLTLLLLACTAHDFYRRCNATRMLSKLMTLPGMPEEEFYSNFGATDKDVEIPSDVLLKEWKRKRQGSTDSSATSNTGLKESAEGVVQMANLAIYMKEQKKGQQSGDSIEDHIVHGVSANMKQQSQSDKKSESCCRYIHFDIRDPENAFAWMLTRRTLRKCGAAYFRRGALFCANYMFAAILSVVIANSYIWTETPHYIFGEVALIVYFIVLTFTFVASAHFASTLQELVGDDRLMLKRDGFLIEKEIIDVNSEIHSLKAHANTPGKQPKVQEENGELELDELESYNQVLETSRSFIRSAEELVAYEEEDHDPIIILGFKADDVIITSILSLCLGSLWLIYEGYSNSDYRYDASGLFHSNSE
ncbi:hypothetical protein TrLO_g6815 [Triparma laevis f. longispina]|uniref:Uncharacterized protein n=1 Tax=Triparma laevis f. longispina TaxID=1714387 RepID=A0A9W7FC11_9STRA|nr:hypothetical protein TrLO_g6815 [Triparma laevis f. longispina]